MLPKSNHYKHAIVRLERNALQPVTYSETVWLLYMYYIDVVKQFIASEWTSDWLLHLSVLHEMLGLFAATRYSNYAKATRVYLQQMSILPDTHLWLYEQFMKGRHSIRRSDRYWSGLSCNLL